MCSTRERAPRAAVATRREAAATATLTPVVAPGQALAAARARSYLDVLGRRSRSARRRPVDVAVAGAGEHGHGLGVVAGRDAADADHVVDDHVLEAVDGFLEAVAEPSAGERGRGQPGL